MKLLFTIIRIIGAPFTKRFWVMDIADDDKNF